MADDRHQALIFQFNGMGVGTLEGIDGFPTTPGKYRYMPFRGPGHFDMIEAIKSKGTARCAYSTSRGPVEFTVRTTQEQGLLEISDIEGNP